jgi:hypothetical protein
MKKLAFILPILLAGCTKNGCPNTPTTWVDVAEMGVTLFGMAAILWALGK